MRRNPDPKKAVALRQAAKVTLERLDKSVKIDYPSDTIADYYAILQRLLEAKAAEEGVKFVGEGAHRELIDYYAADEEERALLQGLREYRNKILYEGFAIRRSFLEREEVRIRALIERLQNI